MRGGGSEGWVVVGPILITLLFVGVSVKLMEDRQIANKGEAFKDYQRSVGSALLLLPKSVNAKLGSMIYGASGGGEGV